MEFECIIYEKNQEKGTAIVKLNRPKVMNAMNLDLVQDLRAAVDQVAELSAVTVEFARLAGELNTLVGQFKV